MRDCNCDSQEANTTENSKKIRDENSEKLIMVSDRFTIARRKIYGFDPNRNRSTKNAKKLGFFLVCVVEQDSQPNLLPIDFTFPSEKLLTRLAKYQ